MNDDAAVLAIVCYGEGEEDAAVALGKLVFVLCRNDTQQGQGHWRVELSPVHACEFCSKGLCILRMQTRESFGILLRAI